MMEDSKSRFEQQL
uniref:Uncharacterized protein n=1 Tax=Anguilla anguilla TaxID=7936 RepID=A0A0E9SWZ3_ANGAN